MLLTHDQSYTSQIRFASLYDHLYLHSGFPTQRQDAVFFGPDTYRYARLLHQHVEKAERVVDIGCGSGAGGLCLHKRVERICLADINSEALRYARINAELAGIANRVDVVNSNILANVNGEFDLVISNPPYMVDDTERTYRHGGQQLGSELSVRIAREGLQRLTVGGKLILYTASAIVNGVDTFWQSIQPVLEENNCEVYYDEIDPDVFGEELDRLAYQHTDRLAVVSLILKKRA
jgi:methylase of polypeptide subunit release factors